MLGLTVVVETSSPRVEEAAFELGKEIWLCERKIGEPLVIITDDYKPRVRIRT
jgi:hypothetical protein